MAGNTVTAAIVSGVFTLLIAIVWLGIDKLTGTDVSSEITLSLHALPVWLGIGLIIFLVDEVADQGRIHLVKILGHFPKEKLMEKGPGFSRPETFKTTLGRKARELRRLTKKSARIYGETQDAEHPDYLEAEARVRRAKDEFWSIAELARTALGNNAPTPKKWKDALRWY